VQVARLDEVVQFHVRISEKNRNGIQSFSPAFTVRAGQARKGYAGNAIQQPPSTLKGVESIPRIPFVEFDFVTAQQLVELVLKRQLAMMFLLSCDVIAHGFICENPMEKCRNRSATRNSRAVAG
jgi:hypothetical protein